MEKGFQEVQEDLYRAIIATMTHAGGKETKVELSKNMSMRIITSPELRGDFLTTARDNGNKRYWYKLSRPNDGEN